jgi:UDP-3-O-[3-hydroxymyristoyl] N-acetylglucosamine deacetylase
LIRQRTLSNPVTLNGKARGQRPASLRLGPAEPGSGIVLVRLDLPAGEGLFVPRWHELAPAADCVTLCNPQGHRLGALTDLLAALHGLGVDNVQAECDGSELPLIPGGALAFASAFLSAGIVDQPAPLDAMIIRRPVRLRRGDRWAELLPAPVPRVTVTLDGDADERARTISTCLSPAILLREVASTALHPPCHPDRFDDGPREHTRPARIADPARGSRARHPPEQSTADGALVRAVLNVFGHLALGGIPLIGHYRGNNPCCHLNAELLRLTFNDRNAWYPLCGGTSIG